MYIQQQQDTYKITPKMNRNFDTMYITLPVKIYSPINKLDKEP